MYYSSFVFIRVQIVWISILVYNPNLQILTNLYVNSSFNLTETAGNITKRKTPQTENG